MPAIFLIGLMGAGKTTVGRALAARLGLQFVDSDQEIERERGCSIAELFARDGEAAFRDIEAQVIDVLTRRDDVVLATGGGAVLRPENRKALRERGTVVYLRANPDDLAHRLRHDRTRPLLQQGDMRARLHELYRLRDPLYRETAHFVIDTGKPSTALLTNMVQMQLELAGAVPLRRPRP